MKPGQQPKANTYWHSHTYTHVHTHISSRYFTPCICQLWTRFVSRGNVHKSKLSSLPCTHCESVVQNTTAEDPLSYSPTVSPTPCIVPEYRLDDSTVLKWLVLFLPVCVFYRQPVNLCMEMIPFLCWNNPLSDSSFSLCAEDAGVAYGEMGPDSASSTVNTWRVVRPQGVPPFHPFVQVWSRSFD